MVPLASVHTTCLTTRCEFFWLIVCSDWCLCVCLRLRVLRDPSSSLSLPKPCHLWPFGYRRFSTSWETWTLSDQPICSQTPCSYPTRVSPKVPFKGGSPVKFSDLIPNLGAKILDRHLSKFLLLCCSSKKFSIHADPMNQDSIFS